jgi:hypothetical protein
MKRLCFATMAALTLLAGSAANAQTPQAEAAAAGSPASISVKVIGTGIKTISPTSCTFKGGQGSANQQICQFSATTVPAGGSVTWALNGGPNDALFVMSPAGMLSAGPHDVPVSQVSGGVPIPYVIYVKAAGQ